MQLTDAIAMHPMKNLQIDIFGAIRYIFFIQIFINMRGMFRDTDNH